MYNWYFHEIMFHVTRPCRMCGNLEVRQLIECPAPDYDLYPICGRCDQVMDDYGRITDYDEFYKDESFYYVPYYCLGCGQRVYPPDDQYCICEEE
jgi:hypothetical protein